jgi:nicotinate phosphoribosyltransferase
MHDNAVFSLFVRDLPEYRNYMLFAGLESVLRYLETVRFTDAALDYLKTQDEFHDGFLDWLSDFRFTGDVYAMPEGTPFFAEEPVIEVEAPVSQAQLFETFIMNQVHHQTMAATKASRVVNAAGKDRAVVDFGLRRMHGADAGVKSARSFHIAGVKATSNVYGGFVYGVPISGTMAHSYVQAHDEELDAFRSFTELYPDTILLVDTYDTLEGVKLVIKLAEELGDDFRVSGIRLDSGDLEQLAFASRKTLDDAGLSGVSIFASSSLDEYKIDRMVKNGAPIDGFGVGTHMGVSDDEPYLDMVYKLVLFAGEGRLKTSPGKGTLPGRKQVFRQEDGDKAVGDVIAGADENHSGRKLLGKVMDKGRRLPGAAEDIEQARETAERELGMLPENILALEKADPPYEVRVSEELRRRKEAAVRRVT